MLRGRIALACLGAVALIVCAAVLWQYQTRRAAAKARLFQSQSEREKTTAADEGVLAGLDRPFDDFSVRQLLAKVRAETDPEMRRHMLLVLGEKAFLELMPALVRILEAETEEDLLRGDALHAIAVMDERQGLSFAQRFKKRPGHLGAIARRILAGDPVITERRENVRKVVEQLQ